MPPSLRHRPPLGWVSKIPWPHRLPSQVVTTVSVCYTGDRCLVLPERAECGHALLGPTPVKIALLAIAGAAGALARYGLGSAFTSRDFPWTTRSEEQTSELQSLLRISYAVFCLNKK